MDLGKERVPILQQAQKGMLSPKTASKLLLGTLKASMVTSSKVTLSTLPASALPGAISIMRCEMSMAGMCFTKGT